MWITSLEFYLVCILGVMKSSQLGPIHLLLQTGWLTDGWWEGGVGTGRGLLAILQQGGQVASFSSFMKCDNRNTDSLAGKNLGISKGHDYWAKAPLTVSSPVPQALFPRCNHLQSFLGCPPPLWLSSCRTSCRGHGLRGVIGRKGQGLEKESFLHTVAPRWSQGREARETTPGFCL